MDNTSLVALLQASALLAIMMWFTGTITTYFRGKVMEGPNKEDGPVMNFFNRLFFVPVQDLTVLSDNGERDATVNRWLRIGDNNTANIPISLFIFYLAAQFNSLESAILVPLIWVFVGASIAHTLCYMTATQPFRTAFYSVASICMIIAAASLFTI